MQGQNFEGNAIGQVVGQQHNHYHGAVAAAPHPAASVACPQCTQATWRLSQFCRHCHLDLFAWRRRLAWVARRARARRIAAGLGLAAAAVFLASRWAQANLQAYLSVLALLLLLGAVKLLEQGERG